MMMKTHRLQSNRICLQVLSGGLEEEVGHPDRVSLFVCLFQLLLNSSLLDYSLKSFDISYSFKNLQFHETEQYVYNSIFAYFINLLVPKDEETKCFHK